MIPNILYNHIIYNYIMFLLYKDVTWKSDNKKGEAVKISLNIDTETFFP